MQERLQQIVESWLPYERDLFFLLNGSNSVFLDNLMATVTGRWVWIPFYAFVLFVIFWKMPKKESFLILLFLVVVIVICDQFSAGFTRPFFERYRPLHHPDFSEYVRLVGDIRAGRFGFISSHATNSFGFAIFLSLLFRYRWVTVAILIWALIKSYSRIYLGLHFVTDFLGGAIVGALVGGIMYWIFISLRQRLFRYTPAEKTQLYSTEQGKLLAVGLAIILVFIIAFSPLLVAIPR
jgi:undecaprenyl-diphosphatase